MAKKKISAKRLKKEDYWQRLQKVVYEYKNVLFINADNVSSKQILMIRARLREIGAYMIMGKNTLMKAALQQVNTQPDPEDPNYKDWQANPNIDKIMSQLKGNINLIFSNGDLGEIKDILDNEIRPSPAKAGMIAPKNVSIPAGSTGLDPKQTSFFQNLQIQTKIIKAQIEIVSEKQVIFEGEKIGATQAALLDKLKIYPFEYKMKITKVLQDGSVFDSAVLDLSTDQIIAKFKNGVNNMTNLSLGLGYSTTVSAPHTLLKGFKNLIGFSAASGYEFDQAKAFLDAAASAPATTAAVTTDKVEVPEPETEDKKSEEEDVNMGGLFGDDDEY